MRPFFVVIVLNPTSKAKHDEGASAKIVLDVTVLAKDREQATLKAMAQLDKQYTESASDLLEVHVADFFAPAAGK